MNNMRSLVVVAVGNRRREVIYAVIRRRRAAERESTVVWSITREDVLEGASMTVISCEAIVIE